MTLNVNGAGNTSGNAKLGPKSAAANTESTLAKADGAVPGAAATDALFLGAPLANPVSSRQVALTFAAKMRTLQTASEAEYDQALEANGSPAYLLVNSITCLCRDTHGDPLADRLRALNMIQHVTPLPEGMREVVEAELERTSSAA